MNTNERSKANEQALADRGIQLAGDHMTYSEKADGTLEITFDDKGTGRVCGSCTLCCKLLPVPTINKPAGQVCQHQRRSKGCTVYADRPFACRVWSCRWVSDREATEGMPRPDRCHYVIDTVPDQIMLTERDSGRERMVSVIQVWVDPAYRDAWRSPELRAFMQHQAEKWHVATMIRWSSSDALCVFPPRFDKAGEWHEMTGIALLDGTTADRSAFISGLLLSKDAKP